MNNLSTSQKLIELANRIKQDLPSLNANTTALLVAQTSPKKEADINEVMQYRFDTLKSRIEQKKKDDAKQLEENICFYIEKIREWMKMDGVYGLDFDWKHTPPGFFEFPHDGILCAAIRRIKDGSTSCDCYVEKSPFEGGTVFRLTERKKE